MPHSFFCCPLDRNHEGPALHELRITNFKYGVRFPRLTDLGDEESAWTIRVQGILYGPDNRNGRKSATQRCRSCSCSPPRKSGSDVQSPPPMARELRTVTRPASSFGRGIFMNRTTSLFAGLLLAATPLAFSQESQAPPQSPEDAFVIQQLVAWTRVQKPQPAPQPLPPRDQPVPQPDQQDPREATSGASDSVAADSHRPILHRKDLEGWKQVCFESGRKYDLRIAGCGRRRTIREPNRKSDRKRCQRQQHDSSCQD